MRRFEQPAIAILVVALIAVPSIGHGLPTSVAGYFFTGTLVAGTGVVVNATDGLPYGSFRITVTNTSGTAATVSSLIVLLQAS